MSIVSGLSDILVKMGGAPVAGDNSDEILGKIAKLYPGQEKLAVISETLQDNTNKELNASAKEIYEAFYTNGVLIVTSYMTNRETGEIDKNRRDFISMVAASVIGGYHFTDSSGNEYYAENDADHPRTNLTV